MGEKKSLELVWSFFTNRNITFLIWNVIPLVLLTKTSYIKSKVFVTSKRFLYNLNNSQVHPEVFDFTMITKRASQRQKENYHLILSDTIALTPMTLFHPSIFEPLEEYLPHGSIAEDVFDEEFMYEVICSIVSQKTSGKSFRMEEEEDGKGIVERHSALSLDQAIVTSIKFLDRQELKKRM